MYLEVHVYLWALCCFNLMPCVISRWSPDLVSVVFATTELDPSQCPSTLDDAFFPVQEVFYQLDSFPPLTGFTLKYIEKNSPLSYPKKKKKSPHCLYKKRIHINSQTPVKMKPQFLKLLSFLFLFMNSLKDQAGGVCSCTRCSLLIRSLQECSKNNNKSCYQAKELSAKSSSAVSDNKQKRSKEESMRKIMDLNYWGPTTTKF